MPDSFEVGFPDGQYMAHGISLDTALKLANAFHNGTDPQPVIASIADLDKRKAAQRITNNLANHPARGKGR